MGCKYFGNGHIQYAGEVIIHDDLEILSVQGQVPPEELMELFGTWGFKRFQKWLFGQTVGEIGPFVHDVIRYMNGLEVID